jgi:hypothetical protein
MFRECSHQFGEFPEIIGVMGSGNPLKEYSHLTSFPNHHAKPGNKGADIELVEMCSLAYEYLNLFSL